MNRQAVFEQLKIDEGVVYAIYKDHLGYPTFGVGHLVLESDPEHGQDVGTPVSEERTKESEREREREFRLRFVVLHSRSVVHDPYNTNSCTCVFLQDYEDKIIHNRIHAKLVVPRTLVPRTSHGGQLVNGI